MITLYTFGRRFGLPDPSPFVTKAEVLLKIAGLDYRCDTSGFSKAPKGKLPYIEDDGEIVADSAFIRFHIEKKYGLDLDKGLSPEQRATAWAFEKMCEDHLYWAAIDSRWMVDANFDKGPRVFFKAAPAPIRPFIMAMVRRQIRSSLKAHGMGRHTRPEIEQLAAKDLGALSAHLGERPWFGGESPAGTDATMFAFIAGALCPFFETPIRDAAQRHANLVAYRDRGMQLWYPELMPQRPV